MNLRRTFTSLPLILSTALMPVGLLAEPSVGTVQEVVSAKPEPASAESLVKHKPWPQVSVGERLEVKAKLASKDGVQLARVYFKSPQSEQYSFVVLNETGRNVYSAALPAVGGDVAAVEYKIVFKDGLGEVYKTAKYSVGVVPGAAAGVALSGFIDVFSEYPEDKTETIGFSDTVRYSYGVGELVTQSGYVANVASPGAGYVGATSGAASSASGVATGAASSSAASGSAAGSAAVAGGSASVAASTGSTAVGSAAATTATTTGAGSAAAATGIGVLPVATAVVGGAVAVVAVTDSDSSSTTDNGCFTGIVRNRTIESDIEVTRWVEYRSGIPYGESVSNSVNGCEDDPSSASLSYTAAQIAEFQANCITEEDIESAFGTSVDGIVVEQEIIDTGHECQVVFQY